MNHRRRPSRAPEPRHRVGYANGAVILYIIIFVVVPRAGALRPSFDVGSIKKRISENDEVTWRSLAVSQKRVPARREACLRNALTSSSSSSSRVENTGCFINGGQNCTNGFVTLGEEKTVMTT